MCVYVKESTQCNECLIFKKMYTQKLPGCKKGAAPIQNEPCEKKCEIQSVGQEMAVMVV